MKAIVGTKQYIYGLAHSLSEQCPDNDGICFWILGDKYAIIVSDWMENYIHNEKVVDCNDAMWE